MKESRFAGFRLDRSGLRARSPRGSAVEVARRIRGLHAQVMSSADLSLWTRVRGLRPDDLPRALWEERTLVKTWLMRGTLHLVPADDLPLYVAALHDRGHWTGAWLRYFETTATEVEQLIDAIADALDAGPLTREELVAAVGERMGKRMGRHLLSGWGTFLKPAARRGLLAFGPPRGRNVTFVRPERWLGAWRDVPEEEAKREVARRYLSTYGPATRDDFAHWLGLARRSKFAEAWRSLELVEVSRRRFALAEDADALESAPAARGVRLLPAFDPFLLAHADRTHVVPPEAKPRVYRTAGWVTPVVLDRGRAVAAWKHERRGRKLNVTVEPFGAIRPATIASTRREAAALTRYLGGELEFVVTRP